MIKSFLGSIEHEANKTLKGHQRNNATLIKYRRSIGANYLNRFLFGRSIFPYLLVYMVIVIAAIWDESLFRNKLGFHFPAFKFFGGTSDFITAQVTALGLIFPMAVGLVTVILQKNETSSTNADIQIYYHESLAYPVGASCISLLIIFVSHLFFLDFPFVQKIEASALFLQFFLPLIHLFWLVINCIALWVFLKISLSFVQPHHRENIRKIYAANVAIPNEIKESLLRAFYLNKKTKLLGLKATDNKVFFGYWSIDGAIESKLYLNREYILSDVFMRPLLWVIRRWLARINYDPDDNETWTRDSLIFPLEPGRSYSGEIVLCCRRGDKSLTPMERFTVRQCFRFKRVRDE